MIFAGLAPLQAQVVGVGLWVLGLGPPALGGTPVPDRDSEIDWLLQAPWAKVALLTTLAVGVLALTNMVMKRRQGGRGGRPRPGFDLRVARLESLPSRPISAAQGGPVHLEGVLARGEGGMGEGPFACVYHNRHGSGRATAIAAELVLLRDASGLVGLDGIEAARVIAPREDEGPHDTISLYLGDRVQVLGDLAMFESAREVGGQRLVGLMGSLGQIQIRVLDRARPPKIAAPAVSSGSGSESESESESESASGPASDVGALDSLQTNAT